MQEIVIDGSVGRWTAAARSALSAGWSPETVDWIDAAEGQTPLFPAADLPPSPPSAAVRVPPRFVELARDVGLHRDPRRWALLYRLLWRLTHGETHLLEIATDPDVHRARGLEKAVDHDRHKMRAFVRFQAVVETGPELALDAGAPARFVAWYEPDHHIVESNAPWFRDRYASQRWSILTPDRCAHWDGAQLEFTPGIPEAKNRPSDAAEELWRTYYRSTFNPARLKLESMSRHMPRRFWAHMPELRDVAALAAAAAPRVDAMIVASEAKRAPEDFTPAQPPEGALTQLKAAVQGCRACALWKAATCAVFGEGPAYAKIVVVGEQPGDQEDKAGRPFVGPAGKLLDRALVAAGLDRKGIYLTNAVKHFKWEPRGKVRLHAKPSGREMAACRPWLEAELKRIQPELIICLGGTAARSVCGTEIKVTQERGKKLPTEFGAPALITLHPSALLRLPQGVDREAEFQRFVNDLKRG